VILQLYDGQSQDIKVGAYEAHTLGNIDKNIVWRGSKEVLRLAESACTSKLTYSLVSF
jgi:hypothetical protein